MSTTEATYRPVITGATGGDAGIGQLAPNRVEFREFVKDKRQLTLFARGLEQVQATDYKDNFSFPAVGGIHGMPNVRWGESGPPEFDGSGNEFGGYCTHSSVLFPTWHRPYVALWEQSVYVAANKVVEEYCDVGDYHEWQVAARNLRAPFWDWALPVAEGEPAVPVEIRSDTITILVPQGHGTVEKAVKNPIQSYTFQPDYPYLKLFPSSFNIWETTVRYPTTNTAEAKSNNDQFNSVIAANNSQLCTQVYQMLTRLNNWPYFSNASEQQNNPIANSLETIHNTVHLLIGGTKPYTGHAAYVPVAGFDPAFWLHHVNVDRQLALWEAINPGVWVTPGTQPNGTYTIKDNAPIDAQSDLTPFWNSQSSYWKSAGIVSTKVLNYSYPDFDGLAGSDKDAIRAAILARVHALYGPKVRTSSVPVVEWSVHIKVKQHEVKRSYAVEVYFEEVLVGSLGVFVNGEMEHCANCRDNANLVVEGFVHLNEQLLKHVSALEVPLVKHFLAKKLSLRVSGRKEDDTAIDISRDLSSFKAAVFSQVVTPASGVEPPTLGEVTYHHDVLFGKPGHTPVERW